ncbi:hypothetical protein PIB30_071589 [Stylosanthes scabra]|uniref:LysM domain-containing protein n=1 Tax=Stylosanthes scabra TaxID=79078 RepID=A0ABU6XM10_9FABA|nr:hypothetical protein [Stylosanthes scabra]
MGEKICWNIGVFVALMLVLSMNSNNYNESSSTTSSSDDFMSYNNINNKLMKKKVCDEIYVVGEGETLQTISEKCGDPFIVEENPHIHDPDDVFPGLVIKINPFTISRLS